MGKFKPEEIKLMKENQAHGAAPSSAKGSFLWAFITALVPIVLHVLVNHIDLNDAINIVALVASLVGSVVVLNTAYITHENKGKTTAAAISSVNTAFVASIIISFFVFKAYSPAFSVFASVLIAGAVIKFSN